MTDFSFPPSQPAPETLVPIAFEAAPCRRRDGWTEARQRLFIDGLRRTGSVSVAARVLGMSVRSVYKLRERWDAEGFAEAWDIALSEGLDRARASLLSRALEGRHKPIIWKGKVVGWQLVPNDRMMIAALRHACPPRGMPRGSSRADPNFVNFERAWDADIRRRMREELERVRDMIETREAAGNPDD